MNDLIGRSWEDVGRCWGLVREVNRRFGRELPAWDDICTDYAACEIAKRRRFFIDVSDDPRPGDVVHITADEGPPHVAAYLGGNVILNVSQKWGVHRVRLTHPQIRSRIEGIYRYVG
jgi:cell wall-associated NlpC family hydrolase